MAAKRVFEYRFLLVGKSGSGKSSTANNFMGEDLFPVSTGLAAGTTICEVRTSSKPQKGAIFRTVDTPGLFDPNKSNKEIADEIVKAAANLYPGLHAVLYVIKVDRYTPEEQAIFNQLKALFDANVVKYVVIIFTGGDDLKKKKMTKEALLQQGNENFQQVLQECGNRVVIFNNAKRDPKHTKELLDTVDKIWKENGETPYSCALQGLVNVKLERRVTIRIQEKIERDPTLRLLFHNMAEDVRKATKDIEDHRKHVDDTKTRKEMTETMIAEKKAVKEKEEQEKKQREKEEKEQRERAEKEEKELKEKKKLEEEEKERKRKEEEKKAEEEKERKRQEQELQQLQKQLEELKMQQKMHEDLENETRKIQEDYERKLKKEREKHEREEKEKTQQDIVKNKETHWTEDVAQGAAGVVGGAWKMTKAWLGY